MCAKNDVSRRLRIHLVLPLPTVFCYTGFMSSMSPTSAFSRILDSFTGSVSRQAAEEIANLRADPALQARLDELAGKANEGQLTQEEREEYEQYVEALDLIAILQAKARTALAKHA